MPIDKLKLDRSLILKFLTGKDISVIKSIISLAHSLNLDVVAEGIEDLESINKLIVSKCDIIQGYYFSRPIEAYDVPESLNIKYELE